MRFKIKDVKQSQFKSLLGETVPKNVTSFV
jgi:hypothetical protein